MLLTFNFEPVNNVNIESKNFTTTEYKPMIGDVVTFRDHLIHIGLPELNQDFIITSITTCIKDNDEIEQTIFCHAYQNPHA